MQVGTGLHHALEFEGLALQREEARALFGAERVFLSYFTQLAVI